MRTIQKTIHTIIREKNSRNGNPMFTVVFNDSTYYKIKPDCACAYGVTNHKKGDAVNVTLAEYRKNTVIVDIAVA